VQSVLGGTTWTCGWLPVKMTHGSVVLASLSVYYYCHADILLLLN